MSLRYQLAKTRVRVIEIAPPAVKSNLGGSHDFGEPTDEFCEGVFQRFAQGEWEIGYKMSEEARLADRAKIDKSFLGMAQHTKAPQVEP